MSELFLTFDTEDFISEGSIPGLHRLLEILKKYEITGLFFITGHMAEKLYDFPIVVNLLNEHQIGYHSSGHSVHPTIFEFTDVENYEEAYQTSILRETAHINPSTGAIEGKGGIHALRNLFPNKQIVAFRAPGHCWTPPHIEALRNLGITFDFSANISDKPVNFKGIVFYPYPIIGHWHGHFSEYCNLFLSMRRETSVLTIHPSLMVNALEWDLIFYGSNPQKLKQPPPLSPEQINSQFREFDLLVRRLKTLQRTGMLQMASSPAKPKKTLHPTKSGVEKCYLRSIRWATAHNYVPKFIRNHFARFFELSLD
ncbi:MAG: polysaccharide deacetylase family protein [Candidatus Bathyarchaeota archaeon]|nr:polysaccharide deacetylase family protein [Candidatus Bathyarchaeota archaeon]